MRPPRCFKMEREAPRFSRVRLRCTVKLVLGSGKVLPRPYLVCPMRCFYRHKAGTCGDRCAQALATRHRRSSRLLCGRAT